MKSMTFDEFMVEPHLKNAWVAVDNGNLNVYVRKFTRHFEEGSTSVDLATFTAEVQGTGSMTRFLDEVETQYSVFVENVFDLRLQEFLVRRGYKVAPEHSTWAVGECRSYYHILPEDGGSSVGSIGVSNDNSGSVEAVAMKKDGTDG